MPTSIKLLIIGFVCLIFATTTFCQEAETKPYAYNRDVFIDMTAALGNLLSITPPNQFSPYGFGVRYHGDKNAIRISANVLSNRNTTNEFVNNDFLERVITNNDYQLRVGYERAQALTEKFNLLFGWDVLGGYSLEKTTLTNTFNRNTNEVILGGGPALRIEFKLTPRIYLSTESTLYGRLLFENDSISGSGVPPLSTSSFNYDIRLQLPQAFFLSFAF